MRSYKSFLVEKVSFEDSDDMFVNWKKVLKKPDDIYAPSIQDWDLYLRLTKKKPPVKGKSFKIEKPLYKYGVITDKSYFSGPTKQWDVYTVLDIISNDIIKVSKREAGGSGRTVYLFVKGKGVYAIQGNWKNGLDHLPDEYKEFINEERKHKYNSIAKVQKALGGTRDHDEIIDFIRKEYDLSNPDHADIVADIVGYYKIAPEEYFDEDGNLLIK